MAIEFVTLERSLEVIKNGLYYIHHIPQGVQIRYTDEILGLSCHFVDMLFSHTIHTQ